MDHKVTLIFTKTSDKASMNRLNEDVLIFQNPLIRKEPISNYSSIADLSQLNTQHTLGPVDGSLYATIEKRNSNNNNNENELTVQNIRTIETRLNAPISKNSRILSTILEWDNARNENGTMVDGNYSHTAVATRSSSRQEQQQPIPPQRSYVKSPLMQSYDSGIYSHEVSNSKQKFNLLSQDRLSGVVRSMNYVDVGKREKQKKKSQSN